MGLRPIFHSTALSDEGFSTDAPGLFGARPEGPIVHNKAYLLASLARAATPGSATCPNCGSRESTIVARKYVVFALRRCRECQLQFRAPTDAPTHNDKFYQDEYSEGMTTEVPDAATLEELKRTKFRGTDRHYERRIDLVRGLGISDGARIFDFGCSWGYGSWQFAQAGFQVESFELSRPRRAFAIDHLGVRAHDQFPLQSEANGRFDVFFSSHVLEHVPSPSTVLEAAFKMVRPGGFVITIVPNGSEAARATAPDAWRTAWGSVHPNFLDERYFRHAFGSRPYVMTSSDGQTGPSERDRGAMAALTDASATEVGDLSLFELIAIAKA
jgi:hypothetical protein